MDYDFDDDFYDDYEDSDDCFGAEDMFNDGFEVEEPYFADDEDRFSDDRYSAEDWLFLGGAMGWAYEEGLNEKLYKKKSKDSSPDKGKKT